MDYRLYQDINGLSGDTLADHIAKFLALNLPAILVVLVALTFLVPWAGARRRRRSGAALATAAAGPALLINQLISHVVERTRPYMAHPAHAHLLIGRSHDPSFPSDHATGAFALAFGIWLYDRTIGGVLLVLAAILSLARVYVGTHYPGDVIAGALIGITVAGALYAASPLRRLIEAVGRRCGELWDRVVLRRPRQPTAA